MTTLRRRFESFVRNLDGFEDIDSLLRNDTGSAGRKRADYLLLGREVIVEQKALEVNPADRPQNFAKRIMRERGIFAFGTVSTRWIFSGQPDGEDLQRKLMLDVAKTIDDDVAKADKQTRDTRLIFNIPNSTGVIIFLNERADLLRPDVIHYALCNVFQKMLNAEPRYRQNDGVIVISEASLVEVPGFLGGYPINTYTAPRTDKADRVIAFSEMLMSKWAAFAGFPLVRMPPR